MGSWFTVDLLLGFGAVYLAYAFTPYSRMLRSGGVPHLSQFSASIWYAVLFAVTCHIFGLHNPLQPRQFWPLLIRAVGSAFLALGALAFLVFAVLYHQIGRYILAQSAGYAALGAILIRTVVWRKGRESRQRLLLIGAGRAGQQVKEFIQRAGVPFDVIAFVDHKPELTGQTLGNNAVLGTQQSLAEHCRNLRVDEVIACVGGKITEESMKQLMDCLELGVRVSDFANFIERNFYQVPVENIRGEWFLQANLELSHPAYVIAKRGTDIAIAVLGLVVLSPGLLLAALAIKLESRGPIFYSQVRCGLHNRAFRIWKLRSMRTDAEAGGPKWAAAKDPRITRVGSFLRRSRLDEVPQFWNILRGEMSLVGPRPERPEFVEKLGAVVPFYQQRHLVKPGLTGWAQINYPYGSNTEDALCKLRYDLYYIKHASMGLDLQIALRTIGVAMKGAR